jgi:hypothetical protein
MNTSPPAAPDAMPTTRGLRTSVFSPAALAWLDAIVDWTPVAADALGPAVPSP